MNAAEAGSALTITGTTNAENGQTVTVDVDGTDYTGTASGGTWSVTVPTGDVASLADAATIAVTADVEDAAGNPATQATTSFDTDLTAPTVAIDAIAGGELNLIDLQSALTITGTTNAENGQTVTVSFDGTDYTGTASGGTWSIAVPTGDLSGLSDAAPINVTASATDAAGNPATQATVSLPADFTGPSITIDTLTTGDVLNAAEAGVNLSVTGDTDLVQAGQTVTVMLDGESYTGAVQANGTWSVTIPTADLQALSDSSTFSLTADVDDADGLSAQQASTSTDTDYTSPTIAIDALGIGAVMNAAEAGSALTITGTTNAENGQTVTVDVDGTDYTGTASGGTWSVTVPTGDVASLADAATIAVTANVEDAAGNPATQATTSFDTDLTAPTVAIDPLSVGAIIDVVERGSDLTVTGTTDAADGRSVTVTLDGETYIGSAGSGTWSVTIPTADLAALTDETAFSLTADVSSAAGNAATQASVNVSTDYLPTLTLTGAGDDGALVLSDVAGGLTLSGTSTGLNGESVSITVNGSNVGSATVAANGSWALAVAGSAFSGFDAGDAITIAANATVSGRDPAEASESLVAYEPAAYFLVEIGRSGSTVTFALYADPDTDISSGLSVDATLTFDTNVATFDTASDAANGDFALFLVNDGTAATGTVTLSGAAVSFGDINAPIMTFDMTVVDAGTPITIDVTTPTDAPGQSAIGTALADTIAASDVDSVTRGLGGDDAIDLSAPGINRVVFEADPADNGSDTITGFSLGSDTALADVISFADLDASTLRGAGTAIETLASGDALGTDTGFVTFTTALSSLSAADLADAAETLIGENSGDVFYMLASDGTDAALVEITFSGTDAATADVMATFTGMDDVSGITADNILHVDPTGTAL
jgi:hypothetical protein